jgi:hypothetical protein
MCGSSDREGPLTYWRCGQCRAIFSRLTATQRENTIKAERATQSERTIQDERATHRDSNI